MKRRSLVLVLILVMIFASLPGAAFAKPGPPTPGREIAVSCVDGMVHASWRTQVVVNVRVRENHAPIDTGVLLGKGREGSGSVQSPVETGGAVVVHFRNNKTGFPVATRRVVCTETPPVTINDGRVNAYDLAAPVAIYCVGDAIDVFTIDQATGEGTRLFSMPMPAGDASGELINEGGVAIYRLPSGEFQLNTKDAEGKDYVIIWDACPFNNVYHP